MEVINRKSLKGDTPTGPRLYVDIDKIRFNVSAVNKCKLAQGKYVHFTNDEKMWTFVVNDDPDGFNLVRIDKRQEGLLISSRPLSRMMIKAFGSGYKIHLKITELSNGHFKISL